MPTKRYKLLYLAPAEQDIREIIKFHITDHPTDNFAAPGLPADGPDPSRSSAGGGELPEAGIDEHVCRSLSGERRHSIHLPGSKRYDGLPQAAQMNLAFAAC